MNSLFGIRLWQYKVNSQKKHICILQFPEHENGALVSYARIDAVQWKEGGNDPLVGIVDQIRELFHDHRHETDTVMQS